MSFLALGLHVPAFAQKQCGTVEYQKLLQQEFPQLERTDQFEEWLRPRIENNKAYRAQREAAEIITIPVVFHVINKGEPVGVGSNIADGQLQSQIDVLNEDFRRMNADQSNTPSVFQPVAADIEFEFVLAKQDPEGLPTNGIVRLQGNKNSYNLNDNYNLKVQSYWPSDQYLNIWVADIEDGYLGYAQLPVSSLNGLEESSTYALTDGVVLDFRATGSIDKYPAANISDVYNLGRTGTHEVGHYFGLRHIWGDSDQCGVDDYCIDTPLTNIDHAGLSNCTFPTAENGCGSNDMFQNYMDYTDDACMNLFTLDQKSRMRTVIDNSPRRVSLKTSRGAQVPVVVANDLGIRSIISPRFDECMTSFTPEIQIRNYGSNTITGTSISLLVDQVAQATTSFPVTLAPLESTNVQFDPIDVSTAGIHEISFEITSVNGVTDGDDYNNSRSITMNIPETTSIPIFSDLSTIPPGWIIQNLDNQRTWEIVPAPNGVSGNQALKLDFFNYENPGELDLLTSPAIDLSFATSVALTFDVSYGLYPGVTGEGLYVTVDDMCQNGINAQDTIYFKTGTALGVTTTSNAYTPASSDDWTSVLLDLTPYAGSEQVRISFVGLNNFGNNLYLDNISIFSQDEEDIALQEIAKPSFVACDELQEVAFLIKNVGVKPITSFSIDYTIDNGATQTIEWTDTNPLYLSDEVLVSAPASLSTGNHIISALVKDPNGILENNTDNNALTKSFVIDNSSDFAPIKEAFEDFTSSEWIISNPDNDKTWEPLSSSGEQYIGLLADTYTAVNERDWLVSPSINLANLQQASLNFDLAYSPSADGEESLVILASTDCGQTYDLELFNQSGSELVSNDQGEAFFPASDEDWRNVEINLNSLIGVDNLRLAFVSINNNGNNLFLDNIQIYVTEHDDLEANTIYPNPTLGEPAKITFDLLEKETVTILVYDRTGHLMIEDTRHNVLNQTYTLDLSAEAEGIYLIKVVGESFSFVKRLMKTD